MPTSRVEIDLRAIDRNLAIVRRVLAHDPAPDPAALPDPAARRSPPGICAVLKQDAYGLGAARIAKRLAAVHPSPHAPARPGVELIATYTLDEARAIYEAVPNVPLLVFMPIRAMDRLDPLYRCASEGRLHLVVHDLDQVRALGELVGKLGVALPVHLQLDTGLTRGGETPQVAARIVERILNTPRLMLAGVMTHFASPCSDAPFTDEQTARFAAFIDDLKPILRAAVMQGAAALAPGCDLSLHLANSAAAFRSRRYHGSMVRVGQCLYGYALEEAERANGPGGFQLADFEFAHLAARLEPAVRWVSSIVHVQEISPGWPVGYGSTWRAPKRIDQKKTRIAIVPVGYADGYPRTLGGAGEKRGGGPGWVGFTGRPFERPSAGEADEPHPTAPGLADRLDPRAAPQRAGVVYAPVVGRVSMDQITVDVTDVPDHYLFPQRAGAAADAPAGFASGASAGEVEIFSRDKTAPNYPPTLAAAGFSITHELLCRVSPRVERVYRYPANTASHAVPAPPAEALK